MNQRMKQNLILVAFGIFLYAIVMNLNHVIAFLGHITDIILPFLIGLVMAFVLSVPMRGYESLLTRACSHWKRKPKESTVRTVSLILTLLTLVLVLALVCTIVIPQVIESIKSIGLLVQEKGPAWVAFLQNYDIDAAPVVDWMSGMDLNSLIAKFARNAGSIVNTLVGTAATTVSQIFTWLMALVIMIYVMAGKQDLLRQTKKLIYAYLKKPVADRIVYVADLLNQTYAKFLSGQCVEAVILGILMFVALSIFRLPYAGLIAVLTAVCSFVPYVGAFISCAVGVLLTLVDSPQRAVLCFVVYQVTQFIENQFIYPRVVGSSVGLSPLWTLVAVLVGGNLFGLIGMIFFIPLTAVLYMLLRDATNRRLAQRDGRRELPEETVQSSETMP